MLKDKNRREQFMPTFFSIIFNPYYFNRRAIYTGIKKNVKKLSGDLLDFGCGYKPYESLFNVEKYIGIDLEENDGHSISPDKIDIFYDGKKIPFEDNSFDSIYSSEVFEHVFNLESFLLMDAINIHKNGF